MKPIHGKPAGTEAHAPHDPAAATQPIRFGSSGPDAARAPTAGEFARSLGAALGGPLDAMAAGLQTLSSRLGDKDADVQRLSSALEDAQRAARTIDQFARLAVGEVRQAPEQLLLDTVLLGQLRQWQPVLQERGIELRQRIKPARVLLDAALLGALLDTAISWSSRGSNQLQVRLEVKIWPEHAQLSMRSVRAAAPTPQAPGTDDLDWQLLQQIAAVARVAVERSVAPEATTLVIEFPGTVTRAEDLAVTTMDTERKVEVGSRPASRGHASSRKALIITDDARLRLAVTEQCRRAALQVQFAPNVAEAGHVVQEHGSPNLLIIDENQQDGLFATLRSQLLNTDPDLQTIEITNVDSGFHIPAWGENSVSRVARDAIARHLAAALETALNRLEGR